MKIGQLNFIEYLAGEEQNLLASVVNFRSDLDIFYNLDAVFQEPMQLLEVTEKEELIPSLYLFVHFHLYFSVSCLLRSHFSECLASARKAIDGSLSAYKIILEPEAAELYKTRDKTFLFIKSHIQNERKKDDTKYPKAEGLLELHDMCSEYGSHADVSSFVHRVEVKDLPEPGKQHLMFHYFQFPSDPNEYAVYFIDTLWAFYGMLLIFRDYYEEKVNELNPNWGKKVDELGLILSNRREELYSHFKRVKPEVLEEGEA
ncbi:MAG: hypothetical protein BMS9Abin09_0056 [Gammaproteobacteria bacterium]|nr:MAG: hypothetical protein BMS9Abin09_0056 [Gammaproteobacteria bacterium]